MDSSIASILGGNIKFFRERAGLTQLKLAEKIGVGVAFVSRVERGEKLMKIGTLLSFADALNVSAGLLLYQESKNEQLQTIIKMLEGQPSEFIDGVIKLVSVCVENFENKRVNPSDT